MSQEGILFKLLDKFIGVEVQMVDFLGQFMHLAKKNFEPGKIYNLQEFCFVKRKPSESGEGEILQFFNEKLEIIEEVALDDRAAERVTVNEFLSFDEEGQSPLEIDISPRVNEFFNDILSLNDPGFIKKRGGRLSRILLEEDRKGERYTDRPDIPLFEDSEDGFQKVNPISKAFEEEEDLAIKSSYDEEPDLFSDLGLNPEKDHEEPAKPDFLITDDEPEVVFTHSSLVTPEDEEEDDEESYSIFSGGMKITPVTDEDETPKAVVTDPNEIENFLESLIAVPETIETPEIVSSENEESHDLPEAEIIETKVDDLVIEELPESEEGVENLDEVPESEEVVENLDEVPESEEIVEIEDEVSDSIEEIEESMPEIENLQEIQSDIVDESDEIPQKKQRISIFDDFDDLVVIPETVPDVEENINPLSMETESDEDVEPLIEVPEVEVEPEMVEETTEPEVESEQVEYVEIESAEETIEPEIESESVEVVEIESIEETIELEVVSEKVEEVGIESLEDTIEPEVISETVEEVEVEAEEETNELEIMEEIKIDDEVLVETKPEEDGLMFDESFFDGVIDITEETKPETKEVEIKAGSEVDDIPEAVESISEPELIELPPDEVVTEIDEPLPFKHLDARGEVGENNSVEKNEEKEYLSTITADEPEQNNIIKDESQSMDEETEPPKSQLSVLIKMLIVLAVIIATYFILSATGFLRGKNAVKTDENLAQGALVIVDSNLLADNREYPFNKDTQNDVNIKGAVFKDGRYFEVEENGTLNPVLYDTAKEKTYKVFVPVDSASLNEEKKAKKDSKTDKKSDKKPTEKSTGNGNNGNITLQDAVKNKVKETKIADFIFKSGKKYYVQLSAHRAFDTAEKLAKELKKKGYKSFVMKIKKSGVAGEEGIWYRVRVGPFDNEEKAHEVNNTLNPKKKK